MKYLFLFLTLAASLTLSSCHDEPAPKPKEVERAVLVYMVSNNSLFGYDQADIQEMIQACQSGLFGDNRLLVYQAARQATPQLIEITPDGTTTLITYNDVTSSITVEQMRRVIADFKRKAPAQRYGLILWSHASGWLQNGITDPDDWQLAQTKAFGDDGGRYMNITALASALTGEGFDYIYFDCCHMANVETLYQLRDCADFFVGSTTILPSPGMPYHLTLKYLMPRDANLVEAAATTFEYYNSMTGMDRSATMSVIRASELQALAEATANIYERSTRPADDYTPQKFVASKNCYVFDFENYIDNFQNVDPDLMSQWKDAFNRAVIYSAATPRIFGELPLDYHCGLSTYILQSADDATYRNYNQLAWWPTVASKLSF